MCQVHFRTLPLKRGVPQGFIFGPILITTYVNYIPLSLSEFEVDIYADDTTISSSGYNCDSEADMCKIIDQ
jgi:hypothetical protein